MALKWRKNLILKHAEERVRFYKHFLISEAWVRSEPCHPVSGVQVCQSLLIVVWVTQHVRPWDSRILSDNQACHFL